MKDSEIIKSIGAKRFNTADQPAVNLNMFKRRLLSQHEQTLYACAQIEEIPIIFSDQIEACKQMDVSVALILVEIMNIKDLGDYHAGTPAEVIARHLLSVLRAQDLIAIYGSEHIACLLSDADQVVAAKVCQRIKEAVHGYAFLHHLPTAQVAFGVADDGGNKYCQIETVIFAANRALTASVKLGDGAIVRAADLDPASDLQAREHFFPGDRLSSRKPIVS